MIETLILMLEKLKKFNFSVITSTIFGILYYGLIIYIIKIHFKEFSDESINTVLIILVATICILLPAIKGFFVIFKQGIKQFSLFLFFIAFPLLLIGLRLGLSLEMGDSGQLEIIFPIAIGFFPFALLLKSILPKQLTHFIHIENRFFQLFKALTVSIAAGLAILTPRSLKFVFIILNSLEFNYTNNQLFLVNIGLFLFVPILILNPYLVSIKAKRKLMIARGLLFFSLLLLINSVPNVVNNYYEKKIKKVETYIYNNGLDADYSQKLNYRFLRKAYLSTFNRDSYHQQETFQKIFDGTPEQVYGDKLNNSWNRSWSSRGTNASMIGEKAKVLLKLAEITNTIKSANETIRYMETTYDFHFTNTIDQNQEVIIHFEAPSKDSVVSDLLLGLNGEMVGQVAPRNAAKKVYDDSLRVNKDPALIEKVGVNSYSLRIFPIPGKSANNEGRQRVQLKVITPLDKKLNNISYSPKFTSINVKYDSFSKVITKVFNGESLILEEVIDNKKVKDYLLSSHFLGDDLLSKVQQNHYSINELCKETLLSIMQGENTNTDDFENNDNNQGIDNQWGINGFIGDEWGFDSQPSPMWEYEDQPTPIVPELDLSSTIESLYEKYPSTNGYSIFFDNSYSARRNKADRLYKGIFEEIKNYGGKLQDTNIYTFNTSVEKIADIRDIRFWGSSDTESIMSFIEKEKISGRNIIIITDDDSYNVSTGEDKHKDLTAFSSNTINVIKIGKNIKSYKSEFNAILAAANGNIYDIEKTDEIPSIIDSINLPSSSFNDNNCYSQEDIDIIDDENIKKIIAGIVGQKGLNTIKDADSWYSTAEFQTNVAEKYNIVNQFNAMIALENDRQQQDLNRYSQQQDKYDSEFQNFNNQGLSNQRSASPFQIDTNNPSRQNNAFRAEKSQGGRSNFMDGGGFGGGGSGGGGAFFDAGVAYPSQAQDIDLGLESAQYDGFGGILLGASSGAGASDYQDNKRKDNVPFTQILFIGLFYLLYFIQIIYSIKLLFEKQHTVNEENDSNGDQNVLPEN